MMEKVITFENIFRVQTPLVLNSPNSGLDIFKNYKIVEQPQFWYLQILTDGNNGSFWNQVTEKSLGYFMLLSYDSTFVSRRSKRHILYCNGQCRVRWTATVLVFMGLEVRRKFKVSMDSWESSIEMVCFPVFEKIVGDE